MHYPAKSRDRLAFPNHLPKRCSACYATNQAPMTDCVVVGGGIVGLLTARELADAGLVVTLIERGRVGREASWASGGVLSPLYPWRVSAVLSPLVVWSQNRFPDLAAELLTETGIDTQWRQSGLLILEIKEQAQALRWGEQSHCSIEYVDYRRLRDMESNLAGIEKDGLWIPAVAQIRSPRLLRALTRSLEIRGATLLEQRTVRRIRYADGCVRGVETDEGIVDCSTVVIAAGAWSAQLEITGDLPIRPVRGQMVLVQAPIGFIQHIVLKEDYYLIPRVDGKILMGSTLEEVGFDKSVTRAARDAIIRAACGMFPGIGRFPVINQWAGLRPASPSAVPLIGRHPSIQGLYFNTGHFRNGVVLAPAAARLLTDLILGRAPIIEPGAFQLAFDH